MLKLMKGRNMNGSALAYGNGKYVLELMFQRLSEIAKNTLACY